MPELHPNRPWHALEPGAVEAAFATGPGGLDADVAARRLTEIGPNEIETAKDAPAWEVLLGQFRDPLIYVLVVAAGITLAIRDYSDTAVIVAVIVTNAAIGYPQARRAQRAIRALARLSAPQAEVVRGGVSSVLPSRDLVPGDVVVLASGSRVPADLRVTRAVDLEVDESALTGESETVHKQVEPIPADTRVPGDQVSMAFAGTVVTRGRGRGVVVATGAATELGRIASEVRQLGEAPTPLQMKMEAFGKRVGALALLLGVVVGAVGLIRGLAPGDVLLVAVAMVVSVIPEGLPVVLTVTLAVGVRRMAARKAIIRSLPAVETLGSTTVIGSDKTGTLTRNAMTVRALWAAGRRYDVTGEGYGSAGEVLREGVAVPAAADPALRQLLVALVLASEADAAGLERDGAVGDPSELAIYVAAAKAGVHPAQTRAAHPEVDMLPFEPERRLMATLNDGPAGRHVLVKGAPEVILSRCAVANGDDGAEPLDVRAIHAFAAALAGEGMRVLAAAYRAVDAARLDAGLLEGGLVFAGLVGMEDPVRPEAVSAVADAHAAGIRVLMLTGDHVDTARAAGRRFGLRDAVLDGSAIDRLDDDEFDRALTDVDIYARVSPEHKLRVVQRLKSAGEVVAVTGDGVNDAPALRAAHIGIAMGRGGTDVAREASDMVLADDNFATITAAVEEGRLVFANIRKVTFFLLSTAVGEVLSILGALALGWPLPLAAAQILWINLVTNGLQDVALAFEPREPGLLARQPRRHQEGVVTLRLLERLVGVGIVLAAGTLGVFWWAWQSTGDLGYARTLAMTQMVVFQFFHVFNARSLDRSILRIPLFSNRILFASIVAAGIAHLAALHVPGLQSLFGTVPLGPGEWALILTVGTAVVVGGELDKAWNRRRGRPLG